MKIDPNILIVLVGLPRSGKTTWALDHLLPIVSLDAIRQVFLASNTPVVASGMVDHTAMFMVRSLFMAGHRRVILDDCNLTRELRDRWYPKAANPTWLVQFVDMPATVKECIGRAEKDHTPTILKMADIAEPLEVDEVVYG